MGFITLFPVNQCTLDIHDELTDVLQGDLAERVRWENW